MQLTIQYIPTTQEILPMVEEVWARRGRFRHRAQTAICVVLAAVFFLSFFCFSRTAFDLGLGFVFSALAVLAYTSPRVLNKMAAKTYCGDGTNLTLSVLENEVTLVQGFYRREFPFSGPMAAEEFPDCFAITLERQEYLFFPKACLSGEQQLSLRAHLEEQLGERWTPAQPEGGPSPG